jgi:hypothetical protein
MYDPPLLHRVWEHHANLLPMLGPMQILILEEAAYVDPGLCVSVPELAALTRRTNEPVCVTVSMKPLHRYSS